MKLQKILNGLQKVKKSGKGYTALCPAHDDRQNSLSIVEENDKILIKCHAGCRTENILKALNLRFSDLFLNTQNRKKVWNVNIFIQIQKTNLYIK